MFIPYVFEDKYLLTIKIEGSTCLQFLIQLFVLNLIFIFFRGIFAIRLQIIFVGFELEGSVLLKLTVPVQEQG